MSALDAAAMSDVRDRLDIAEVQTRYAIGMDRGDRGSFASAWTEDAVWVCAELGLDLHGHAAIMEYYDRRPGSAPATPSPGGNVRLAGSPLIELAGDRATAVAEFVAYRYTGSAIYPYTMGHYDDEFRRTPEGWRLSRRDMIVCPVQPAPGSAPR